MTTLWENLPCSGHFCLSGAVFFLVSTERSLLLGSDYTGTPQTPTTVDILFIMQGSGVHAFVRGRRFETSRSELIQRRSDLSTHTHTHTIAVHIHIVAFRQEVNRKKNANMFTFKAYQSLLFLALHPRHRPWNSARLIFQMGKKEMKVFTYASLATYQTLVGRKKKKIK